MVSLVFPDTGHQGRHPGCDSKRDHADSVIMRPASRTGFGPRGAVGLPVGARSSSTRTAGERGMQWIADRFNGLPTTPNCGQF